MDQISLNSNHHNANLVYSLDHFKALNSFVDVTLVCEGHTVKAHKVILSAGSNVLHRLMLANPAKHPIIILTETRYDTLRMIVDFLYKGRIDVPRNEIRKILATAVTFEMNELKRLCQENLDSWRSEGDINSHPCSKSPDLSESSPKKKQQRRQSSDSDVLYDAIFPKREISSPCILEQSENSLSTQTESAVFHPQIADARTLDKTYVESATGSDLTTASIQNVQRRDASTECDIEPLKELENNLVPIKPARIIVRPRYIEKSDDSESDSQNPQRTILSKKRRSKIWNYFTAVSSRYAICKLCQAKLSYKTTVTNLTKHLQKKHRQFDPKNPPKLPEVPLLRIQTEQLEIFEDVDFSYEDDEGAAQDKDHPQCEEGSDEGIPSTSTPFILKIT